MESPTLVSDANPAKRIASEKEEQGSGRSFRRQAEAEPSVLCDDAGATRYDTRSSTAAKKETARQAVSFKLQSN